MKKVLLSLVALAAMVACNNEETVVVDSHSLITFDNSFVEVKTRVEDPSITSDSIDAFDVWGFIDTASGTVFSQEHVTKNAENKWDYANKQYWLPNHTYYFYAVAPANAIAPIENAPIEVNTNGMNIDGLGTINFTNVNGTLDLLYAEQKKETGADVITNDPGKVSLQFMHLLSKVMFTFKNEFTNDNTTLKVTGLKIVDAPKKGSVAVNKVRTDYAWVIAQGETTTLEFGDVNGGEAFMVGESKGSDRARLTIPADATRSYTIEFDLTLYYGDQVAGTSHKSVSLENQAFVIGKNYNIVASVNPTNFADDALAAIEFDVITVERWEDGVINGNVDFDNQGGNQGGNEQPENPEPENPEEPEQPAEPVVLAAPTNVAAVVENGLVTVTWTAVENAASYDVTFNGETKNVTENTCPFTAPAATNVDVEYTVTVVAKPAEGANFTASAAAEVTFTIAAAQPENPEPTEPTYTSVADFLAAAVDTETYYYLKGTITAVANTSYGNFDLTDDTGTVYVYGLYSEDGATNKYWASSGAKLGDDIVIYVTRGEFSGKAQGTNARFVELLAGTRAFWTFSKDAVVFGSAAAEETITVEAYNTTDDFVVTSDNDQFSASYANGVLTISVLENTTVDTITGNIVVACGALTQTISVIQSGVSTGGGEKTVDVTMSTLGYANAATVTEVSLDENVKVTFAKGAASNAPAYYDSGEAVRLYQNGATMTVTANGKTIKSMEITFANSQYYMAPNCGEFSAEADVRVWTGDATEVKFTTTGTDKNHRAYISAIKVTYLE